MIWERVVESNVLCVQMVLVVAFLRGYLITAGEFTRNVSTEPLVAIFWVSEERNLLARGRISLSTGFGFLFGGLALDRGVRDASGVLEKLIMVSEE